MSNYALHRPRRRNRGAVPLVLGIAVLVVAALLVGFVFLGQGFAVTIAGHQVKVPRNTTVGDLVTRRLVVVPAGDVTAVNGVLIANAPGAPGVVLVNGKPAPPSQRLRRGDVVTVRKGAPSIEPVVTLASGVKEGRYSHQAVSAGASSSASTTSSESGSEYPGVPRYVPSKDHVKLKPGVKYIALTFDDGPWPKQTLAVLAVLQKYDAKATFFEIGGRAKIHPELTKALVDAGMEIGNHTFSHKILTKLSAGEVDQQIRWTEQQLNKIDGKSPTLFRPPGGAMNAAVVKAAKQEKVRIVMWDIDPNDWKKPPVKTISDRVVGQAFPGAIVLMHDGGGNRANTIAALKTILRVLKQRGYTFVTVSQLYDAAVK